MKCTNCDGNFAKVEHDDIIVMKCDGCGSFYVKEEMFKELTEEPEKYANQLDEPNYSKFESENKKPKKCPECGKKMEPHNFSWDTDIIIDVCNDCKSLWLDHGEISKLADYIDVHHGPLFKNVKHDVGRFLHSIKYFMYKVSRLFP